MRIMEIISGDGINGAARHCALLTRQLVRRGNDVTLVCRPNAWVAEQLAGEPVTVVHSDLHRIPFDELRRIAALAKQREIEVIHTHMSRAHFFGVLLRAITGIPCVATAHSRFFQLHWRFNDLVIAVSEATRRFHHWVNFVPLKRLVTIPNFIEVNPTAAGKAPRERLRQSLGVAPSACLIGTVGSVIPRKGILYLIRALPKVLSVAPRTRLMIVGDPGPANYMQKLRAEAERLDVASQIVWTGPRNDIPDVMAALDLCVLASLEETFGLVLLEAMEAGVPVVATAVGGIPECVCNGVTGTLVRPADPDALARGMLPLVLDSALREQFGQAGRRWVAEHFSPERQVTHIEAAFDRVASRRRAA